MRTLRHYPRRLLRLDAAIVGLLLLALLPLPVLAQPAATERVINLSVLTPHYEVQGTTVHVPGSSWHDVSGAPRLPVYGTVIELPAQGSWQIDYRSESSRLLSGRFDIPAVPTPELSLEGAWPWSRRADLPGSVPLIDRPSRAIYGADAFYPAAPIQPGDVQWQRGRRLLALRVFPFQYNPVTKQLRYHPDLEIRVTVTDASDQPPAMPPPVESPTAEPGAVWVRTGEAGMYQVTYADLLAAGVAVDTLNPVSLRMTNRDVITQIQVIGALDGRFDPGDRVIFFGEPYSDRYTAQNVYRLAYATRPAPAETRISERATTPTGAEPVITAITQTLHIELDRGYYSSYPISAETDHYFDDPLYPSSYSPVVTRTYTLALDDPLPNGNVQLRAQLYGGQEQAASPDQSVAVWLNDVRAATWQWDGRVGFEGTATVPAATLDPTANAVKLEAALSQLPGLGEYWVYPDWVEVTYPALAETETDRLSIAGIDLAGLSVELVATGFTTDTVRVYDVRNPRRPVQILTTQAISTTVGYALHVWDAWGPNRPAPRYALTTDAALLHPVSIEIDRPSSLQYGPHAFDYIAIVHPTLSDAIEPLLAYRRAQGLRTAKVDLRDIYDEFNAGFPSPQAIRDFLTYAYTYWNVDEEPPRYVLLVGDGHYDFKGVSGTRLPNLIPPYLINIDPWIGETAADNRFVSVDGPDDYLPDMAIGRIPAITPAEVTAVVSKTLAYEDPTLTPDGDWQSRAVYVADDYDNPAGNFHALSDDVRTNWLPPIYEARRVYYRMDPAHDTGAEMRTAIKSEFNQGAIYLQWFGHANVLRWGTVSMWNLFDPPTLNPNNWMPFTVHLSCWTGYFIITDSPYGNGQTVAENMVVTGGRSSVVDLAPSGLHLGSALSILDEGLTLAIFRDRVRPAGDAVNAAKLTYFANSAAWHDVIDTEILFGDPALRLRVPVTPPTAPEIAIAAKDAAATLSWPHVMDSAQYEVWRDTAPYFTPAAEGVQVGTVDAGFVGRGAAFTFEDGGALPPPEVQIIGDATTNYFWVARSRNGDGASALSNRVGEFDFSLTPGDKPPVGR